MQRARWCNTGADFKPGDLQRDGAEDDRSGDLHGGVGGRAEAAIRMRDASLLMGVRDRKRAGKDNQRDTEQA